MVRLLRVRKSTHPKKKYTAFFDNGKLVHFGGKGCKDYIQYQKDGALIAETKRRHYIARHSKGREHWNDPTSPGALSRWILWEYPSLAKAIQMYNTHFV